MPCCISAIFFLAFVAEGAQEGSGATCSPQQKIFQLVLGQDEDSYVVDGKPEPALQRDDPELTYLPRGCQKWAGESSCCKKSLFESLDSEFADEKRRFATIRDVYAHLREDAIQPAIDELMSQSQEEQAKVFTKVGLQLEKYNVGKAIISYIDNCEDPIRLHFAATTCELCNPDIGPKLPEGKYLEVSEVACENLWLPCSTAMHVVNAMGMKLKEAADKLKAVVDAGVRSENVAHAHVWLSGAAKQMRRLAVDRINFYADKDQFCKQLQEQGFKYDPEAWGNLDYLHPSMALVAEAVEAEEVREEEMLSEPQISASLAGQCVHGVLRGSVCFCKPCWEGLHCQNPAKPGPMRTQPYSPLVAEDVVGSQQSLAVIGCKLPTDLNAQLARIKFLKVEETGGSLPHEDPCPLREAEEGSFRELPLQVPVAATQTRLEYLVQTPQGSEGLYAVCYCFGPECLADFSENSDDNDSLSNWWLTGYLKVVRTDAQAEEAEHAEKDKEEKDPRGLHGLTGRPTCDTQWKSFPLDGVSYERVQDSLSFECAEGYEDLLGAATLQCHNGIWTAQSEDGHDKEWDGQLPRCRWKHRECSVPQEEGKIQGGGYVLVEDGIAKYTCPAGAFLLADATSLVLKEGAKVQLKAGDVHGVVVGQAEDTYDIRWELPGAGQRVKNHNANEFWAVMEDNSLQSFCHPGNKWVPAVAGVHCQHKPGEPLSPGGDEGRVGDEAGGVLSGGHGPCGGTFGVPEVHPGQANDLIAHLFGSTQSGATSPPPASYPAHLPAEASLLESPGVPASGPLMDFTSHAEPQEAGHPLARRSSGRLVHSSRGSKTKHRQVRLAKPKGRRGLRIQQWPVIFSKDPVHSFDVDRCWVFPDCLSPGLKPLDTAAAVVFQPPAQEHLSARSSLSTTSLALGVLVVCFLLALIRSFWLSFRSWNLEKPK